MKRMAHLFSYLFHPIFLTTYVLMLVLVINPYLFSFHNDKARGLLIIMVFLLTTFFPLLAVAMMRALGLIKSFEMEDKRDRIGPMIATSIFYLWLFLNIKDNLSIPKAFQFFILGATIALFIAFFINVFQKISIHGVGIGGFLTGVLIIGHVYGYGSFFIRIGTSSVFQVNLLFIYVLALLIAGITLTSRLILNVHNREEVYGGFLVGVCSQIIAFMIFAS